MKTIKIQFNILKAIIVLLLFFIFQMELFSQSVNFTEHIIDNQVDGIRGVYACDIDNDTDNDIVITSLNDHEVALWRNDGGTPVVFTKQIIDNELNTPLYIYTADIDDDGHIDVIASDYDAGEILWWQNNGNNPITWTKKTVTDNFASAHGIFACDIDNDGNTDVLSTSEGLDKISWWQNNGENPIVWSENIIAESFDGTQSVFATDIDDDGDLDVMGVAGEDNEIALWYNEGGNPISWTKQTIDNNFGFAHWVYAIDVNGDSLTDILGAAFTSGDITCWYNEGGSPICWDKQVVDGNFYGALTVHGNDLDGDNDTDIIGTNWSSDDVVWWENDGNTPVYWTKHIIDGYFNGSSPIFTADLDGDTDIDIVAGADVINGSGTSAPLIWWENDLITYGSVINVPGDQPTIQEGIDAAANWDTVLVAPGTYFENINFKGKNIVVASHYVANGNLSHIDNTVIDGSNPVTTDTASCVRIVSGEDSTAVLQGFTIKQGTGTHWVDPQFPTWTWHGGGGVFVFQSSPTIKNNYIIDNHCDDDSGVDGASGGGVLTYGGNPAIINNIIKSNTALYGAGVVIDYSGCVFKNNIVAQNSGGQNYGGGGFWTIGNDDEPIIMENNTIVDNESALKGGAMYLWSTQFMACNNVIWGNTQSDGGQIYLRETASIELTWSNVEGGYDGEGNMNEQPQFADTSFMLAPTSPCIDAGNPNETNNDIEDPENPGMALWPSMGELRNDMGAYGGPLACKLQDFTTGIIYMPTYFDNDLFKVYLNYSINKINVEFNTPLPGEYQIHLIDMMGRNSIIKKFNLSTAGINNIQINTAGLSNGVYFVQMRDADSVIGIEKVILN